MNRTLNSLRLFLCFFSGEDDFIIRKCRPKVQIAFATIGLFVILIFAGCWISASSFMYSLFDGAQWISFPIGMLWALLVANMYLLLLYTVSPTLLPIKHKNNKNKGKRKVVHDPSAQPDKAIFTSAMLFRIGFILLLATIISQPLNVLMLSPFSSNSLQNFKMEYQVSMLITSDSSIVREEIEIQNRFYNKVAEKSHPSDAVVIEKKTKLLNRKVADDKLFLAESKRLLDSLRLVSTLSHTKVNVRRGDSLRGVLAAMIVVELASDTTFNASIEDIDLSGSVLENEFNKFKNDLKAAIEAKLLNYQRLNDLLMKSNFYVKKIQIILDENPFSWLVTCVVFAMFLLPIYFKYKIRDRGGFYEAKQHIEHRIVLLEYDLFRKEYGALLQEVVERYNRNIYERMIPLLTTLKKIDVDKYNSELADVSAELRDENIEKYEYWEDHPFRTKNKQIHNNYGSEEDLLEMLYPKS